MEGQLGDPAQLMKVLLIGAAGAAVGLVYGYTMPDLYYERIEQWLDRVLPNA